MTKNKNNLFKGLINKQKASKNKNANPVNLEALVNSGRVRITKEKLEQVPDKSNLRKTKN